MKSLKNTNVKPDAPVQNEQVVAKSETAAKKTSKSIPAGASKQGAAKEVKKKKSVTSDETTKISATKQSVPKKNALKKTLINAVKFDKKITDKLKAIVANYTEYPELLDNIESDTTKSFIDELNIDSVDFVEIIVDVEQAFNITIDDEEIYNLKSFEDLYLAIERKIKDTKRK